MTNPAKSVYAFGIWGVFAGLGLLTFPSQLLSIVGLSIAEPIYIRVIGFILIEIGLIYLWLASNGISAAFPITVYIRLIPVTALSLFVISGMGPWQLLLFALVDGLSLTHTWWMIKKQSR